jgi:hypothetical protein
MSITQRGDASEIDEASIAETYKTLGEGDTPDLYERSYKVDTGHDVPMGACNSLDRKIIYVDRTLYSEAMDGEFSKTGLEPDQIIRLWCDHEHTEKAIADGDNQIDYYTPSHKRALAKEHRGLWHILGPGKVKLYEDTIWPGLKRCYDNTKIIKPPKDMWCGPLNDDASPRDEEILEILQRLGVVDAGKHGKQEAAYGWSAHSCGTCRFFNPDFLSQQGGELAACQVVSGLVRKSRGSDYWKPKEGAGK